MCFCHTRLHLGFSAKLRIWQVPACKMEPRSGIIFCKNPTRPDSTRPDHPVQFRDLLFLSMLCGVPTPIVPLINKVCAVSPPPSIRFFCAVSPPMQFFPSLSLSWILSKIENLASSSLQDKVQLNLYPRVWHSQLSLLLFERITA